jgi:hypothetical protein
MSTICILNKNIRTARVRRHTAVGEMQRMVRAFAPGSAGHFRVMSLASALDGVRKDPRFTGAEKDAKFRSLLNRAK